MLATENQLEKSTIEPLPKTSRRFTPGFRFSTVDAVVLVVSATATLLIGMQFFQLGIAIAFAISHFFLFCNVFRMRRSLELIWATIFIILVASTVITEFPSWRATLGISLATTLLLVGTEMRDPSYHGVLWQRINPKLPQWWEQQLAEKGPCK